MNIIGYWQIYPDCRLKSACLGHLGQFCNPFNQSSLCPYPPLFCNYAHHFCRYPHDKFLQFINYSSIQIPKEEWNLEEWSLSWGLMQWPTLFRQLVLWGLRKVTFSWAKFSWVQAVQNHKEKPHVTKTCFSTIARSEVNSFLSAAPGEEEHRHIPRTILSSEETEVTEHV